jgi:hypothetical protein
VEPHDAREPAGDPQAGPAVCERARRCPGWFVSEDIYVHRCDACRALASDEQARESALAAGLDVQRSGYVAGVSGVGEHPREERSAEQRATASVNGLLRTALEQLQDAQRVPHVPPPLRSCVDQLVVEIARAQGVSEWLSEDLVRLVDDDEDEPRAP